MSGQGEGSRAAVPLDPSERDLAAGRSRPRAALIYEIIRTEGESELERPVGSLFWSGFAAGLTIAFSLIAEGTLVAYLPETSWRHLVASLGYTAGFVVVVLGRQQLFTENTITAVLPVLAEFTGAKLRAMLRLWGTVLASNLVGTTAFAALLVFAPMLAPEIEAGMLHVARDFMSLDAASMFWGGILAGWLVATMVWLLPAAEGAALWVVVLLTYLIAAAGLSHVIAGATESAYLVLHGEAGPGDALFGFFLPTLAGNIVGGSALFALLSYAQVRREMRPAAH